MSERRVLIVGRGAGVVRALSDNGITVEQIEDSMRALDEAGVPPGVRFASLPDGTVIRIGGDGMSLAGVTGRAVEEGESGAGNPERNWLAFRKQYGRRR